jgi:hypothetical protein
MWIGLEWYVVLVVAKKNKKHRVNIGKDTSKITKTFFQFETNFLLFFVHFVNIVVEYTNNPITIVQIDS